MSERAANPIQTTQTSFLLLRRLADAGGATLPQLQDSVDLSKGAIYNHLATLVDLDAVVKRGDTYYPSAKLLALGAAARDPVPGAAAAREQMRELADTTGEFASIVVPEDGDAVVLDVVAGSLCDAEWLSVGETLPLHATAAGKVILSRRSDDRIEAACRRANETADVDCDRLLGEIRTVQAQGLAFSRGEYREEQYSVAAPVVDGGTLRCVIQLTGPEERLNGKLLQQDFAGLIVSATTDVQKRIIS